MDNNISGNASLLAQVSEIQSIEKTYGREATAQLLKDGLQRNTGTEVSKENAKGFLVISKVLQNHNARIEQVVQEKQDEIAATFISIFKESNEGFEDDVERTDIYFEEEEEEDL